MFKYFLISNVILISENRIITCKTQKCLAYYALFVIKRRYR